MTGALRPGAGWNTNKPPKPAEKSAGAVANQDCFAYNGTIA